MCDGARGQHPEAPHLDRDVGGTEPVAAPEHRPAQTGIGLDGDLRPWHEPRLDGGKGEAAQAVAARLGTAPIRVAQLHADIAARDGRPQHQEPVGPDTGVALAQCPRQLTNMIRCACVRTTSFSRHVTGPLTSSGVKITAIERDQEVVPEALVLDHCQHAHQCRAALAMAVSPRRARTTSTRSLRSARIQTTRGSRLNQASCRRANARSRRTASAFACSSGTPSSR